MELARSKKEGGKTPLTWRQQERCSQMDTRQGEERKGKSIKVPSSKYPPALWLQQGKEGSELSGWEPCSHMQRAAFGACAATAAARGVSHWRDCWAPEPCLSPTYFLQLWAQGKKEWGWGIQVSGAETELVIRDVLRNQVIISIL